MFARCLAYLLSGYQDCIFFLDSVTPCFIHERFLAEYCVEDEDVKFMARVRGNTQQQGGTCTSKHTRQEKRSKALPDHHTCPPP